MTSFIEQLEKSSVTFANRLAVALDCKDETLTYGELWNLSGKVYAYLKNHNIGREDFALINLPRGPKVIVAMIGIWRAGAALTITEKGYPAERVEYIRKDCNAKIVIDENIFNEMLKCEPLAGYEKTSPNDACFAVYTSGTTGKPKGALHEYGKLELCISSANVQANSEICTCAVNIPLNFVAFLVFAVAKLYASSATYIVSYDLLKNISKLKDFFEREEITETFITPSMLKIYSNNALPRSLKKIYVGGEVVSNLYLDGVQLINCYVTSETAFLVAEFQINKAYQKTPVGKNIFGLEILILNEDGQKVSDGEQGEICFENKYFRGYINLPEETEKVLRGGIFHTGDLGFKDEDGNLVISGRADDMIEMIEYLPPVTETEKIICEQMAKILGVEKISRNADFYQCGGDSLKAILLVTACANFAFQSNDVYKYRTPEKLAAFIDANKISVKANKKFHAAQAMQEKFFPAVQKAWEEYQQSGVVSSLYSSIFAADEKAMKKFSAGICSEITLLEKVDHAKLQAAVNKAVEVCPFAAFEISKHDGVVYFKKNNLPLLVGNFEEFGSAQNNYHYVIVSCEDRKIFVNVSHVLTDGFGIICFLHALTDFYFDKEKTFYEGADKFDFVADLMAQELPLPADYTPKSYAVENHFVPPEINSATGGKTYANLLEIQAKKFNNFCKKNRLSAQIALSFLVAQAIQAAHPDNEKIISVRSPVSTRTPLKVPNTFQNASIPHIFLNFEPRFLTGEFSAENWKQIKADFSDQATYENLAAFTNKIRKIFLAKNPAEIIKTVKSYKGQTDIFANYMGKVLADDVAEYTEFFDPKIPATYPFMVYAITLGERIIFRITQPFENKIYVENLLKCLQQLGLIE